MAGLTSAGVSDAESGGDGEGKKLLVIFNLQVGLFRDFIRFLRKRAALCRITRPGMARMSQEGNLL